MKTEKTAKYKTGQLLVNLGNKVTWFRNQKLQIQNLTSEQAGIISFLQQQGNLGITEGKLATEMNHSKATVSETLKKMEKKSLIKRCEDPDDGRKKYIFLTEQGQIKIEYLLKVSTATEKIILQGMSEYEQKELNRLLEIAVKNMNYFRKNNYDMDLL